MENKPVRTDLPAPLPAPPPTPSPSFTLGRLAEVLKAFTIIVVFNALQGAGHAYTTLLDWTKLFDNSEFHHLLVGSKQGFLFGLIPGLVTAGEVLLVIWAGPTLWKYLAPILQSTLTAMNTAAKRMVDLFRRPKNQLPQTPNGQEVASRPADRNA
jgi:hypothetical protein